MPPVKTLKKLTALPDWGAIEHEIGREEMAFALLADAGLEDARKHARDRLRRVRREFQKTGRLPDEWAVFTA